jgi:hypothetical protein
MTILEGKKPTIPTWHLKLILQPQFVLDMRYDQILPATLLPALDFDPFQHLTAEIFYDQDLVVSHRFDQHRDLLLEKHFHDDITLPDHELQVILDGLDVNNNFSVAGQKVTVGVYIKIYVEGIDCDWYLQNQNSFKSSDGNVMIGQSFMSQNGSHTINLSTPIYKWLFDNENLIVQFYQKT